MDSDNSKNQMSPEEVAQRIRNLYDYYHSEGQRRIRLIRMRPPDGGGYALVARQNQRRAMIEIEQLKKLISSRELNHAQWNYQVVKLEEYLDAGFSTKEIARKLNLVTIRDLVKKVSRIVHYANWSANRFNRAIVDREVLVWSVGNKFEVRYYSGTDTGRHSRLVKSKTFSDKHEAIEYAKEIKKENQ